MSWPSREIGRPPQPSPRRGKLREVGPPPQPSPRRGEGVVVILLWTALLHQPAYAGDWSGDAGIELRAFGSSPLDPEQEDNNLSFYMQPEYYRDWDDDNQRFVVTPFLRIDQADPERSHFDLRELYWRKSYPTMELSVGLKKIFWGVTESAHLVDIINQTDAVENVDTEDKLGQPMINLTLVRDWGTVDLFLMPWFRERTFPSLEGRLRPPFYIDESRAQYESSAREKHIDVAARWTHYFGDWDIGLAHFSGTSREPTLQFIQSVTGLTVFPFYDQIEQTSLDLQLTKGSWLWKLESFNRSGQGESFQALAAGFEYTLVGVRDSTLDLGLIAEYLRDNRKLGTSVSDQDIATGFRLAFNDVQSTELLAFTGIDLNNNERFSSIEGSRRLGQSWKISLEARFFSNTEPDSTLHSLRDDDYLQLSLAKYF